MSAMTGVAADRWEIELERRTVARRQIETWALSNLNAASHPLNLNAISTFSNSLIRSNSKLFHTPCFSPLSFFLSFFASFLPLCVSKVSLGCCVIVFHFGQFPFLRQPSHFLCSNFRYVTINHISRHVRRCFVKRGRGGVLFRPDRFIRTETHPHEFHPENCIHQR